jgi:hypothetical protein
MRTVQEIYDVAIRLMDAQNESNGNTNTADNKEYMFRTPDCLNRYINLVYPYSDTYVASEGGKRTVHPKLEAMTDKVDMDDLICFSVLAPALVYELLLEENPAVASARYKDFEMALAMAKESKPAVMESVEMPYGGIEYGEFGHW